MSVDPYGENGERLAAMAEVLKAHQPVTMPFGSNLCTCGLKFEQVSAKAWHRHAAAMVAHVIETWPSGDAHD